MKRWVPLVWTWVLKLLAEAGAFGVFVVRTLRTVFTRPFPARDVLRQIDEIGVKSLPIVVLASLAIGMVLVLQLAYSLKRFGAKGLAGPVVSLSIVRYLGPVITSLLVGGRVGAGITAEVGSMKVTEQIDALRALGADPIKKLAVPRFVAALISFPALAVVADFVGIAGGLVMASAELGVTSRQYVEGVRHYLTVGDFATGVLKTVFFGLMVAAIACYIGTKAEGGTQGVGRATTLTVVLSLIFIIVFDFFLTKLFMIL